MQQVFPLKVGKHCVLLMLSSASRVGPLLMWGTQQETWTCVLTRQQGLLLPVIYSASTEPAGQKARSQGVLEAWRPGGAYQHPDGGSLPFLPLPQSLSG